MRKNIVGFSCCYQGHEVSYVYFVFTEGQAKRIGEWRYGRYGFDVWKTQMPRSATVEEHPPWAGMSQFKEILVPHGIGPSELQISF
jgi:hypothetical protein